MQNTTDDDDDKLSEFLLSPATSRFALGVSWVIDFRR